MPMRPDCKDYTESSFPFEMKGDFLDEAAAKAAFLKERVESIWGERAPKMWNFQVDPCFDRSDSMFPSAYGWHRLAKIKGEDGQEHELWGVFNMYEWYHNTADSS